MGFRSQLEEKVSDLLLELGVEQEYESFLSRLADTAADMAPKSSDESSLDEDSLKLMEVLETQLILAQNLNFLYLTMLNIKLK